MRSKLVVSACAAAALLLAVAAGAEAGTGGFAPVDPQSPSAERSNDVYWLLSAIAVGIFLIVTVPLVLFVVRYRSRGRDPLEEGPQVRGNTNLEIAWTVGPVLILTVVVGYVFYKLPGITDLARGAEPELVVRVEGRQFYWQYEYPNGVVAVDELVLPVERVTELEITAPDSDVIHSFWVPALAGKFDAIPGHVNRVQMQPNEVGVIQGVCGEFCGLQHAAMLASVRVVEQDEFDRWLAEQAEAQEAGESDLGQQLWERACAKCHGPGVVGEVGPPLEGSSLLTNRETIDDVVRNGIRTMPAIGEEWSERQMDALLDYLEDVVAKEEPGGGQG